MENIKSYFSIKKEHKNPYDIRINCLKTLMELQEKMKLAEKTYMINAKYGVVKSDIFRELCDFTKQYHKEYSRCEEIIRK